MGHVRSGMIVAVSVGAAGSVVFFAGSVFEIAFLLRGGNVLQVRQLLITIPYVALSMAVLFGTAGALIGKVLRIAVLPRRTIC